MHLIETDAVVRKHGIILQMHNSCFEVCLPHLRSNPKHRRVNKSHFHSQFICILTRHAGCNSPRTRSHHLRYLRVTAERLVLVPISFHILFWSKEGFSRKCSVKYKCLPVDFETRFATIDRALLFSAKCFWTILVRGIQRFVCHGAMSFEDMRCNDIEVGSSFVALKFLDWKSLPPEKLCKTPNTASAFSIEQRLTGVFIVNF